MRAKNTNRFSRLHQHGLVVLEVREGLHHCVEALPVTRGLAIAAVNDQLFGMLGDRRV